MTAEGYVSEENKEKQIENDTKKMDKFCKYFAGHVPSVQK